MGPYWGLSIYCEAQQYSKMENSGLKGPQIKSNFWTLSRGFASTLCVLKMPFNSFDNWNVGVLCGCTRPQYGPILFIKSKSCS